MIVRFVCDHPRLRLRVKRVVGNLGLNEWLAIRCTAIYAMEKSYDSRLSHYLGHLWVLAAE